MRRGIRLVFVCLCLWAATKPLSGQPRMAPDGVLNHASYGRFGLHNGSIAQGSLFAALGDDLGPADSTPLHADGFPLQTALAETSIQVTVGGTSLQALPGTSAASLDAGLVTSVVLTEAVYRGPDQP